MADDGARIDPNDLEPGMQLTPTLEVVRRLGEGGMGSVWVAFDKKLEREVAVKVISSALMSSADSLRRFQREARIAARVHHPHVVHMFDFGLLDDRVPYLVMELLKGEGLDERLDREGVLTPPACALLVDQLAQALSAAHDAGIVHRDVKPANVFLVDSTYDLFVKIVDFGIAKPTRSGDTTAVTMAGTLVGTPSYMSPEQLLSTAEAGPSADLWGLSVVAYECLTGYLPFDAETVAALGQVLGKGEFTAPSVHRDDLPPELDAFFTRAFALDPHERFQDPTELAAAFVQAAGGLPARSSQRHGERAARTSALGDAQTLTPSRSFPSPSSREMSPGKLGKYQLVAELGHGGMADVYLAVAQGPTGFGFSKLMVVKRLRPSLADDREFVGMIVDEARLAARLNHSNVVQTLEAGRVGKHYFIAMEYLDGQPFDRVLNRAHRRREGMPKDLGYVVVSDMLAGLHHAHELRDYDGGRLNVVHRDVSPHNVFVTYDGQVKVVDFGIARAANRATYTATGVVKGKVFYMAPEQARGDELDRRADLFAAGVLLWETAVGRRFWGGKDDFVAMNLLTHGDYTGSPKAADASVPDAIDAICKRALAHDPAGRYPTAAAMQADLDRAIHELRAGADVARGHANHELGELVAGLFADERQEIQGKIERQMNALAEATHPELIEAVPISARRSTPNDQEAPTELRGAAETVTSDSTDPQVIAVPKTAPSSRMWIAVAGAVAVVGAAVFALSRGEPPPAQPAATPSPETATATSDAAEPPVADAAHTAAAPVSTPGADAGVEPRQAGKEGGGQRPAAPPATPHPSSTGVGVKSTRPIDTADPY
jgi:eukaryotic-like serine/threonine-protein kinase